MNNIEQKINEFENNLEKTKSIVKELSDNNDNIRKLLNEGVEINSIKENLNNEMETYKKLISEQNNNINETKNYIEEKVSSSLNKINEELKKINEKNIEILNKIDSTKNTMLYLLIVVIILLVIILIAK